MITKEQREVEQIARLYESFWNRHDIDGISKLFAEDADFVNASGEWWRSRKAIKEALQASHAAALKNSRIAIQENFVHMLGLGAAVLRSTWTLTGQLGPDGQTLTPRHGILTHVLQNQGGVWMIVASQNTNKGA
jgi:uncharacterized protein (TIGR02246 family)